MSDGTNGRSNFGQNLFIAVISPIVAGLGALYLYETDKVNSLGNDVIKDQTMIASLLELDKRIETDLANISSKYIDDQITIQMLKGNEAEITSAAARLKADVDQERQDRIADINDVRKRIEEVERTFAPIHPDNSYR